MRLKIAILIFLTGLTAWVAWVGFGKWHNQHLVAAASAYFQTRDFRSASLSARQALRSDPSNLQAHTILAKISKSQNSPEAILWQQKIVELQPGKTEPLLDLASTATALGEAFIAERALNQVARQDQDTLAFHQAAVAWAIATRQYGLAEDHLQQARKLDPKNELTELNLATVHLLATNPAVTSEARAVLERLQRSTDPKLIQAATRALLGHARSREDRVFALQLAKKLQQSTECTISDRFAYLQELLEAGKPDFEETLKAMQLQAVASQDAIYMLMTWMNGHGLASATIQWNTKLPVRRTSQMPVSLALAEAYAILQQWEDMAKLLMHADWGSLEFIRFALQARVLENDLEQGRRTNFRLKWDRAIAATNGDPSSMAMLARLVDGWGWKVESAQVWWFIAQRRTGQRPALRALYRMYSEEKSTAELYRVARRIEQVEPTNPVAKNNSAMLALLLRKDLPEAHRMAEESSRNYPNEPAFASTLALSLHIQNRSQEALAILQRLPEAALRKASVAACYGAILAATGDREKAAPFLQIAESNRQQLFPEEAAMVGEALHPPK